MAGAAAAIGYDCRGALHHRFPIWVGHVGNQHIARLHQIHLRRAFDHACRARTNFLPNRAPLHQQLTFFAQMEFLNFGGILARLHRLWPRLHDIKLAAQAIFGPFDIHWAAIMLFNREGLLCQLCAFRFRHGKLTLHGLRHWLNTHAFAGLIGIHHASLFAA